MIIRQLRSRDNAKERGSNPKVVVGMHSTPKFRYRNKDMRIFFEKKYADKFVES